MARTSFALCLILGLLTLGCNGQRKTAGGTPAPPPPKGKPTTFPDCKTDHPGGPKPAEADWSGTEMCNQEGQKDAHMALPAVQISQSACPGIHIHHDQDFTLGISILSDPYGNCLANPFNSKFPFDSGPGHAHDFHTGTPKDGTVGCSYEIVFQPKSGTKCDPHIDITN